VIIYLIYSQYRKISRMEKKLIGEEKATPFERLGNSIGVGVVGGIIGTILIVALGVTVELDDFKYILPLAIILMLINIRYLCFSYAGGLLSLSSLLFGFPKINVSSIIAIVAILHLIESLLIWIDGHRNPTPVFVEHDIYGTVGAFSLQRFWPIPFAVLLIVLGRLEGATEINLPDWWPLFIPKSLDLDNITLQLSVVVAALGYGDMAVTSKPEEKCRKSALRLAMYSILLLILAVISTHIHMFKYIAALFAPLAHEGLILYSHREEDKRRPIYKVSPVGLTVLDVKRGSIGEKMGIKPGNIIIGINNYKVNNKEDLTFVLQNFPSFIWIDLIDEKGNKFTLEHADYRNGIRHLGVIIISKDVDVVVQPRRNHSIIKRLMEKFRNRQL